MGSLGGVEIMLIVALLVGVLVLVLRRPGYRRLAERSVAAHEANERRLAEIADELSGMRTQLSSLEQVLTQVE